MALSEQEEEEFMVSNNQLFKSGMLYDMLTCVTINSLILV